MPQPLTVSQIRLNSIIQGLTPALQTLNTLADAFGTPFVQVISNITSELIPAVLNAKKNKDECLKFMEKIHSLLAAIINLHLHSDSGQPGTMPLSTLQYLGKFAETLRKIHVFVEALQDGNKLKHFFRQSEMKQLLKDCNSGLQKALDVFKVKSVLMDVHAMQKNAQKHHEDLLELIATISDGTISDKASSVCVPIAHPPSSSTQIGRPLGGSFSSSNSLSMLPSEPKIFHGRDSELQAIVESLRHASEPARIAILGAGGMGKTSLARAALYHPDVVSQFVRRVFVEADSASTSSELVGLIGAHLGLKPGNDLTKPVLHTLSSGPPCLLILDNLETPWEPLASRAGVEELLSLLADIPHLGLIITMRGAERPAKVRWSRPFLPALTPLPADAAYQTFVDIADDDHDKRDIEKLLLLTENMPLAVDLIAHLVDYEGCPSILARWEKERTSMLSEGYDRKSSLNASIAVSLSSPRMASLSGARDLLSLVSILPDGISDTELLQSSLPIPDILACKAALLRTSLAYLDSKFRLRALIPIREYVQQEYPPTPPLIKPLNMHFQELVEFHRKFSGNQSSAQAANQITANLANLQQLFQIGLNKDNPDVGSIIQSIISLNRFCSLMGHARPSSMMHALPEILALKKDRRLEIAFITEIFHSALTQPISDPESLIEQALEHLLHLQDPLLECQFLNVVALFYENHADNSRSLDFSKKALAVSQVCGDIYQESWSLVHMSTVKWRLGDHPSAQAFGQRAQRLAKLSGTLYLEAQALRVEAMACYALGKYKYSISLCHSARELLALCGQTGSDLDHSIMNNEAEIHLLKSEYAEARKIHSSIAATTTEEQDPENHVFALLNVAEIDSFLGVDGDEVVRNLERTKRMFVTIGFPLGQKYADTIIAETYLRDGNTTAAKTIFEKCFEMSWGNDSQCVTYCLERLGDFSRWNSADTDSSSAWTVINLAYGLKSQEKLVITKALRYLGDIFAFRGDKDTALSLFTLALEGFTWMDVHRSRAECMLRLGLLWKDRDLKKAVAFWEAARPLFQRSLQGKGVAEIDAKLVSARQVVGR